MVRSSFPSNSGRQAHLSSTVTFFVMPAIFNSLTSLHGISIRIAWRVSFLVPCVLLLAVGLAVLLLTDDTPLGPWSEREKNQPRRESAAPVLNSTANSSMTVFDRLERPSQAVVKGDLEKNDEMTAAVSRRESEASETVAPAPKQSFGSQLKDLACLPTLMLCATYFATFGASLSVRAFLFLFLSLLAVVLTLSSYHRLTTPSSPGTWPSFRGPRPTPPTGRPCSGYSTSSRGLSAASSPTSSTAASAKQRDADSSRRSTG